MQRKPGQSPARSGDDRPDPEGMALGSGDGTGALPHTPTARTTDAEFAGDADGRDAAVLGVDDLGFQVGVDLPHRTHPPLHRVCGRHARSGARGVGGRTAQR